MRTFSTAPQSLKKSVRSSSVADQARFLMKMVQLPWAADASAAAGAAVLAFFAGGACRSRGPPVRAAAAGGAPRAGSAHRPAYLCRGRLLLLLIVVVLLVIVVVLAVVLLLPGARSHAQLTRALVSRGFIDAGSASCRQEAQPGNRARMRGIFL